MDWYSDSSLASNSIRDKDRQPAGSKEINKLDKIVKNNLKNYKYQNNEAIDNEPTLEE